MEEKINIDLKKEKKVYKVYTPTAEQEFWSFSCPILMDDKLVISDFFFQGVVSERILDETVHETYKIDTSVKETIEFELQSGVSLITIDSYSLRWIDTSEEQAKGFLKDKMLIKYQELIPKMLSNIQNLEKKVGNNYDLLAL